MTTPVSQRFIAATAAAVADARASLGLPAWDEAGVAVALRQTAERVGPLDLLIAFARAAADPGNETPAAVTYLNNRAWDSDWWPGCPRHPGARSRTPEGECGLCRADRTGTPDLPPHDRGGRPIPDGARQLIAAAFRSTPDDATARTTGKEGTTR